METFMKDCKNNISILKYLLYFYLLVSPSLGITSDGSEIVEPLEQLITLLSGPVGITIMMLAVVGSGFMFFIGKWDVMRLTAATVGCGLVFGGVELAEYLMI
jgi:type IV secretory pathway VirB2 component (pilin)